MKEKVIKDPICGMSVNEIFAIHAEKDGKKFYFCGEGCRNKFLNAPAGTVWKK